MGRRRMKIITLMTVGCLLLGGCLGKPHMETIVIEDSSPSSVEDGLALLAVKNIYPVLVDAEQPLLFPLGWIDENALLGAGSDLRTSLRFDRINEPYLTRQHLFASQAVESLANEGIFNSIAISPDQRYVSYLEWETQPVITFISLSGGNHLFTDATSSRNMMYAQMSWSNNSRYFSFADADPETQQSLLVVYDVTEDKKKSYLLPQWQQNEIIIRVMVSDDGTDGIVVKTTGRDAVLEWGRLDDGTFNNQFRHPINSSGWVEWLHPDQIIFVGADHTLYAFDQRTELLSTLENNIGQFRVSRDGKYIAYTQEDVLYIASIYGNTLLNIQQVYKGIEAYYLYWSPNHNKLFVNGIKPGSQQRSIEVRSGKALGDHSFVLEFNINDQ